MNNEERTEPTREEIAAKWRREKEEFDHKHNRVIKQRKLYRAFVALLMPATVGYTLFLLGGIGQWIALPVAVIMGYYGGDFVIWTRFL